MLTKRSQDTESQVYAFDNRYVAPITQQITESISEILAQTCPIFTVLSHSVLSRSIPDQPIKYPSHAFRYAPITQLKTDSISELLDLKPCSIFTVMINFEPLCAI